MNLVQIPPDLRAQEGSASDVPLAAGRHDEVGLHTRSSPGGTQLALLDDAKPGEPLAAIIPLDDNHQQRIDEPEQRREQALAQPKLRPPAPQETRPENPERRNTKDDQGKQIITREQIGRWFSPEQFTDIHISPYKGVSWRGSGVKR